jgi:hypothetical protein
MTKPKDEKNPLTKAVTEAYTLLEEGKKGFLEVKEMLPLIQKKYGLDSLEWILEVENHKHLLGYILGKLGQQSERSPDLLLEHPDYGAVRQAVEEGVQLLEISEDERWDHPKREKRVKARITNAPLRIKKRLSLSRLISNVQGETSEQVEVSILGERRAKIHQSNSVTIPKMSIRDLDYPANQLPTSGKHPYQPPKRKGNAIVVKVQGGYLDKYGNVWEWARDQHAGPHWDVQHPDGTHTNVYPDGEVYQGRDYF